MSLEIKSRWNTRYAQKFYVYGTKANDFLRQSAHLIPHGNVLCLGEGEGRNAVFLARKNFQVTAVDISEEGLRKAERLAEKKGVRIKTVCSDLRDYPMGNTCWHGIISIFCHIPTDLRKTIYQRVITGLTPGGIFLLESYTPEQLKYGTGGPQNEDLLVTLSELKKELHDLNFLYGIEKVRVVREGRLHTGEAAVVQLIAQKPQ
jgi:SAM-dependent methyltransferase